MNSPSRSGRLALVASLLLGLALLASCGDDEGSSDDGGDATTDSSTDASDGDDGSTGGGDSTDGDDGSTDGSPGLEQPAMWPASNVVFTTPEDAATNFVETVLGVPAALGAFQQGDSRSGEMEVFFPGEGDVKVPVQRGLLLLRQLGPDSGWFVIAAPSRLAAVNVPAALAEVVAGPLTVEGLGRGFEGTVLVSAYVAGEATPVSEVVTSGGPFAEPEPFTVSLDLSGVDPGSTVIILVQGGTGLETDPGDFGAIPVVIAAG
jgi:hypothetical protein